jgi:hypothetical protein
MCPRQLGIAAVQVRAEERERHGIERGCTQELAGKPGS